MLFRHCLPAPSQRLFFVFLPLSRLLPIFLLLDLDEAASVRDLHVAIDAVSSDTERIFAPNVAPLPNLLHWHNVCVPKANGTDIFCHDTTSLYTSSWIVIMQFHVVSATELLSHVEIACSTDCIVTVYPFSNKAIRPSSCCLLGPSTKELKSGM